MSGRSTKPACQALRTWLKANGLSLAPLTGTDSRALSAAVHALELFAVSGEPLALEAFAAAVRCMQPKTRELAYHAIAYLRDWDDRATLWRRAGLEPIIVTHRCAGERHDA